MNIGTTSCLLKFLALSYSLEDHTEPTVLDVSPGTHKGAATICVKLQYFQVLSLSDLTGTQPFTHSAFTPRAGTRTRFCLAVLWSHSFVPPPCPPGVSYSKHRAMWNSSLRLELFVAYSAGWGSTHTSHTVHLKERNAIRRCNYRLVHNYKRVFSPKDSLWGFAFQVQWLNAHPKLQYQVHSWISGIYEHGYTLSFDSVPIMLAA